MIIVLHLSTWIARLHFRGTTPRAMQAHWASNPDPARKRFPSSSGPRLRDWLGVRQGRAEHFWCRLQGLPQLVLSSTNRRVEQAPSFQPILTSCRSGIEKTTPYGRELIEPRAADPTSLKTYTRLSACTSLRAARSLTGIPGDSPNRDSAAPPSKSPGASCRRHPPCLSASHRGSCRCRTAPPAR